MKKLHKVKNENVYDIINNINGNKDHNIKIISNDFYSASNDVFHIDTSWVSLKDIVLPKDIELEIEDFVFEHKHKDFFNDMNLIPSNKIVLEWEPWCWKTMISYALSNILKRELKIVNLSKIVSPHLWETASNIFSIFNKYNNKDHILFIDEFDIIWRLRGDSNNDHNEMKRVVNSLLQLIDYFPIDWMLIFATNDINIIDKALLRRMDRIITIPKPTKSNIKKFIKMKLKNYKQKIWNIDYDLLATNYNWKSFSLIDRELKKSIKKFLISQKKKNVDNITINTEIFL